MCQDTTLTNAARSHTFLMFPEWQNLHSRAVAQFCAGVAHAQTDVCFAHRAIPAHCIYLFCNLQIVIFFAMNKFILKFYCSSPEINCAKNKVDAMARYSLLCSLRR